MRTNDRGIAVPSERSPLPWHVECDIVYDVDRAWVSDCVASTDAKFITHAANFHERMADLVRRLATVENWPDRMMVTGSALAIAEDAAALWAEYQKEVQP